MMTKKLIYILPVISCFLIVSCLSDNGEDLALDCDESDLVIDLDALTDATCEGPGNVEVSATGGEGPYLFSIDSLSFSSSDMFTNLSGGTYRILVKDQNDCTRGLTVTLEGDIMLEATTSGCNDGEGEIDVVAMGGDGAYEFQLEDGQFTTNGEFSNLPFGEYDVTVRDGLGCTTTKTVKVGVSLVRDIFPIIQANCAVAGCHLDVRSPMYETKEDVIAVANRVKIRTSAGTMPPTGSLPADEVAMIAEWVDCGAQNN